MRYIKRGELQDERIARDLRRFADDYENGEILEVRDGLLEIVGAIDEYEEGKDDRDDRD